MNKNIFKFIAGGAALAAVAVGVLYLADYVRWRTSPEYRAEQYFKELEKRYREDTYGGDTPEETLQLFIDALKKRDIELASKYFVLEKQEEIKKFLQELYKSKDRYDEWVRSFSTSREITSDSIKATFEYETKTTEEVIVEGTNIRILPGIYKNSVSLIKIQNGRWKLDEI